MKHVITHLFFVCMIIIWIYIYYILLPIEIKDQIPLTNYGKIWDYSGSYQSKLKKSVVCSIQPWAVIISTQLKIPEDVCYKSYVFVDLILQNISWEKYSLTGITLDSSMFCGPQYKVSGGMTYNFIHPIFLSVWNVIDFPIWVSKYYHIVNTPYDDINLLTPEWREKREEFLQEHYQFLQTLPECKPNMK